MEAHQVEREWRAMLVNGSANHRKADSTVPAVLKHELLIEVEVHDASISSLMLSVRIKLHLSCRFTHRREVGWPRTTMRGAAIVSPRASVREVS
jgi:hypothetical protein